MVKIVKLNNDLTVEVLYNDLIYAEALRIMNNMERCSNFEFEHDSECVDGYILDTYTCGDSFTIYIIRY